MKRTILSGILSCLALLCLAGKDILVKQISGDATPEVLEIFLSATPDEGLNIIFEKGTYHFYPDKALEFYRHISNHDDVIIRCAFPIVGLENISINGNGSEFIFHGLMLPFIVENSKNVTLENFSIDWGTPFHSEGLVVATNEEKNSYDLKFSEDYPYVIRNGNIYFQKEYGEYEMGQLYFFDPVIRGIAYNTIKYSHWGTNRRPAEAVNIKEFDYPYDFSYRESHPEPGAKERELHSRFEELSPGLVRIYNHSKKLPKIGWISVMKGLRFENRIAPALHIEGTEVFTVRNVDIFHAGGMGLITEYCSDLTLDDLNLIPPEGRMASGTSDGMQLVGTSGKIIIKNCRFANQLDDGINIHGDSYGISEILGKNKLGVRFGGGGHAWQKHDMRVGKPGDTIVIGSGGRRGGGRPGPGSEARGGGRPGPGPTAPPVFLTLKSQLKINRNYSVVTFNEDLPKELKPGRRMENITAHPEVLVSNCEFVTNRARGFLFRSSRRPYIVENCTFNCDMQAVIVRIVGGELGLRDGEQSGRFVFRNNIIQDTPYGGNDAECISISGSGSRPHHIEITDNTINHYNNFIMEISGIDGCIVSGNKITNSGTYPLVDPERPAFKVSNSKNIVFENNDYSGLAKEMLKTGENCENVVYR